MSIANSSDPRIRRVEVTDEMITAHLADGRIISIPLGWSWRLAAATPAQRANYELIGDGHGVHCPTSTKTSAPTACSAARPRVPQAAKLKRYPRMSAAIASSSATIAAASPSVACSNARRTCTVSRSI